MTEILRAPLNAGTPEGVAMSVPTTELSSTCESATVVIVASSPLPEEDGADRVEIQQDFREDNRIVAALRRGGELSARLRNQTVKLKNEQPLRLLAIVAGISFAAGAATRVWRLFQ